jgi:hypothetical protein
MAIIHIDTSDPRDIKALQLCATSSTWTEKSEGAYLIPSQSRTSFRYTTSEVHCTCPDFQRHEGAPCKHMKAVALYHGFRALA